MADLVNIIGMRLVLIKKGTFMMGSPADEVGRSENETLHEVTISHDYYLGMYQVTQHQFEQVMGINPSNFKRPRNPVDSVSWEESVEFCRRLSELPEEVKAGRVYRLPTEAEWEYACRAGNQSAFSFGENSTLLDDYVWYMDNDKDQTHPVGEKKPNAWGLHDMHGNVWEICLDWVGDYPKGAVTDPVGPKEGFYRAIRGGGRGLPAALCRSAVRGGLRPFVSYSNCGFRVAMSSLRIPT